MSTQKIQWVFYNRTLCVKTNHATKDMALEHAIGHLMKQQHRTENPIRSSFRTHGDKYIFELIFPEDSRQPFVYEVYPEVVKQYQVTLRDCVGKRVMFVSESLEEAMKEAKSCVHIMMNDATSYSIGHSIPIKKEGYDHLPYASWNFTSIHGPNLELVAPVECLVEDVK